MPLLPVTFNSLGGVQVLTKDDPSLWPSLADNTKVGCHVPCPLACSPAGLAATVPSSYAAHSFGGLPVQEVTKAEMLNCIKEEPLRPVTKKVRHAQRLWRVQRRLTAALQLPGAGTCRTAPKNLASQGERMGAQLARGTGDCTACSASSRGPETIPSKHSAYVRLKPPFEPGVRLRGRAGFWCA
jgi:hypothetical protein